MRKFPLTGAAAILAALACSQPTLEVGPPVAAFDATPQTADPGLVVDPDNGDLLAVWVGGDGADTTWSLYFARSADGGAAWSTPVVVATGAREIRPHGESSPRLAATRGGRLAVAWPRSVPVEDRKWPAAMMRLARSDDGGATWTAPLTLNDDTTGAPVSHQFHGIAASGDSTLLVAWLDERSGPAMEVHHGDGSGGHAAEEEADATMYLATSPDFGLTWSVANTALWGQVCPCCRVTLASTPDGRVISAWRKHFPGNVRDVVTAPVEAGADGKAVEPARVHEDGWVYPGCPHTGPAMAADRAGDLHVAWYTGKEGDAGILYRRVAPNGSAAGETVVLERARTLPTAHVAVAATPDGGALAAYDVSADRALGIVVVQVAPDGRITGRTRIPSSAKPLYPQLAVLEGGRAVVAWSTAGDAKRTYLAPIRFAEGPEEAEPAVAALAAE